MARINTIMLERTGHTAAQARNFIAHGMLINALLAIEATGLAGKEPRLADLTACTLGAVGGAL